MLDIASDPSDPLLFRDWRFEPVFAKLRREDPVHFTSDSPYGPYWSVTRLDEIFAVESDWRSFSSADNIIIGDVPADYHLPAFATADPPDHSRDRRAVAPAVASARIEFLEEKLRHFIIGLLDSLPDNQPFDWASEVSAEITSYMITLVLGLPQNLRHQLAYWCEAVTTTPMPGALLETEEERTSVLAQYRDTLLKAWPGADERVSNDGLLACLARDERTAELVHLPDRLIGLVTLIAGANEAARGALSGGVVAFDKYAHEWERLKADRELIRSAVGEIIRWQSPIIHMRRTTTRQVELAGRSIPTGAKVILWYCSANRDETYFDEPEDFRLGRSNAHRHAGFGFGVHRCYGQRVANLELRVLWEEILTRFSSIEVTSTPIRLESNFSAGFHQLMVRIHRL